MLNIRPLCAELQRVAIEELNENPENIYEHVCRLRDWIDTENMKYRKDDQYLVSLLRGCKYDLDVAREKIRVINGMRTDYPGLFIHRDLSDKGLDDLMNLRAMVPIEKTKTPDSPRVLLFRLPPSSEMHKLQPKLLIKLLLMFKDFMMKEDDNYVIAGDILILDFKNLSLKHLKLARPSLIKFFRRVSYEAYPARFRGIYAMNVPKFGEIFFNTVAKRFFPAELQQALHITSEHLPEKLLEAVPLKLWPQEYGGNGGNIKELTESLMKKAEKTRDWFLDEDEKFFPGGLERHRRPSFGQKLARRRSSLSAMFR